MIWQRLSTTYPFQDAEPPSSSRAARIRDGLPDPARRCRHVDLIDAERLSASISALITVGGAPMVPDSPMPLTPSGLVLHGTSSSSRLDVRHRVGARHGVIHEAAGEELAGLAVVDLVLHQRLADALHHAALIWPRTIIGLITRPRSSTTK